MAERRADRGGVARVGVLGARPHKARGPRSPTRPGGTKAMAPAAAGATTATGPGARGAVAYLGLRGFLRGSVRRDQDAPMRRPRWSPRRRQATTASGSGSRPARWRREDRRAAARPPAEAGPAPGRGPGRPSHRASFVQAGPARPQRLEGLARTPLVAMETGRSRARGFGRGPAPEVVPLAAPPRSATPPPQAISSAANR
ncbi:putative uncharacterized protein WWC2-AS2 [Trichechus manatus latirostris]|uniref:Uncharacterized protein n=1 Tax=Trichechus manatus latirostris TaxID=127582 RepID=A0A2Y9G091_TRIMA|nr:putative uncharacterized protein WWC2-AS2 [Trichechus manatus latirostris]